MNNKGKLLYSYITCNVINDWGKEIPEDLWTKENLEYENEVGETLLHFLAGIKNNAEALNHLIRAVSLYPEGCLRMSKKNGYTPLVLAIYYENFEGFKAIWNANPTNKIEIGKDFERGILTYINIFVNDSDICQYFYFLIVSKKLKPYETDIEEMDTIMHKILCETPDNSLKSEIIHELLKINNASEKLLEHRL